MMSCVSLASSASTSSDMSECTTQCTCNENLPPLPPPLKQTLAPDAYLPVELTDIDDSENEVVIQVQNWTTIKRVPSLIQSHHSMSNKDKRECAQSEEAKGEAGTTVLRMKNFVEEPVGTDLSTLDGLLGAKQETAVPSLATANSLYTGIQTSHSLARTEVAI